MGRSRGGNCPEADSGQRPRRKKNVPSVDDKDSAATGPGKSERKSPLYHCNYCNKDISGRIRIKCVVCSDFDLCIECFSVGAEVHPHKSDHSYRVMGSLAFPLICPDWNADEEMLLLEALEMYGFENWAEVEEHVYTKTNESCIEHYRNAYLNSPHFPLPDMSHVVGKNKNELLDMARGHGEDQKGFTSHGEHMSEDEIKLSKMNVEDSQEIGPSGSLPSTSVADHPPGKSYAEDKSISSNNQSPTLMDLVGYNPKRHEFDVEYDNDAEQLLTEMEFEETDTETEHELKLQVLHIFSGRLDERNRRKDFIVERQLLLSNPFFKNLSQEEKEECLHYDAAMHFNSKEEHENFLKSVFMASRITNRMIQFQELKAARYFELKRKQLAEDRHSRESSQAGLNSQETLNSAVPSDSLGTNSNMRTTILANQSSTTHLDPLAYPEVQLLSEREIQLCHEIQLTPPDYLRIQQIMTMQMF